MLAQLMFYIFCRNFTMGKKNRRKEREDSDDDELSGLSTDSELGEGPTTSHEQALEEDSREIKRLEKLLGLNKRWKKKKKKRDEDEKNKFKLPSSFKDMGLDYLLKPIMKMESGSRVKEPSEDEESDKQENTRKRKQNLYTEDAESAESAESENEDSDDNSEESEVDDVKPAKRPLADDGDMSVRLSKRAMAITNRLSEPTVPPLFNEARSLYTSGNFPRAKISDALCAAAISNCVEKPTFVVPDKVSAPVAMFFSLLRATGTATDAVGQLIHKLSWMLVEYDNMSENKAETEREKPRLENAIHLLSHLLTFRSLDSFLLIDILKMLGEQIAQKGEENFNEEKAEYAGKLAIALLRAAGPSLRKTDPSGLTDAMKEVHDATTIVRNQNTVTSGSRLSFLTDVLQAVRNNNFTKIPGYDYEESSRFSKV